MSSNGIHPDHEIISPEQCAAELGITTAALRKHIQRGVFVVRRKGDKPTSRYLITWGDLRAWQAKQHPPAIEQRVLTVAEAREMAVEAARIAVEDVLGRLLAHAGRA